MERQAIVGPGRYLPDGMVEGSRQSFRTEEDGGNRSESSRASGRQKSAGSLCGDSGWILNSVILSIYIE